MSDLEAYLEHNDSRIHDELFDLLRIPSVSTVAVHNPDIARAAKWIAASLNRIGVRASIHATPGNPIVVGEWRNAPSAPTVLLYGHYDVQSADPLNEWTSPPFEPTVRDGKIFARGVVDDKAQIFLHIKALEAHLAICGRLPVNVVMLVEGEEEVGSVNLAAFLRENRQLLRADSAAISDTIMFAPGQPTIVSSLRGIVYFQIDVKGPSHDLHSGAYGGAVVNPAMALARILASLQDDDGRVSVRGFYDSVREWEPEALSRMRALPFDEDEFRREAGVAELGGDPDFAVLERVSIRPTCDVHGLLSGYAGEGAKTILPATATAKVSFRLVPDQSPRDISELFQQHVRAIASRGVIVSVSELGSAPPWHTEVKGRLFRAAQRALRATFGREAVIIGEGGTLPILNDLEQTLGIPILLLGFGLPGANMHAADEWMSQENFRKGMRAVAMLWDEYATESNSADDRNELIR
jgi:acetylornithine deacetylase/succinyl-diaminopimelate desuccinylase-like protein